MNSCPLGGEEEEEEHWKKIKTCWGFTEKTWQGYYTCSKHSVILFKQALRDSGIKIDIEIEADVSNLKSEAIM